MTLLALHAGLFLAVHFLLPEAGDVALVFMLLGFSLTLISEKLSALTAGLCVATVGAILGYQSVSRLKFNVFQILENPVEAGQSVIFYLGEAYTVAAIIVFVTAALLIAEILLRLRRRAKPWPRAIQVAVLISLLTPAVAFGWQLASHYFRRSPPLELRFEGGREARPQSDESLIVLQLESLNGQALFNQDGSGRIALPSLKKLEEMGGAWIPHFWANAFGTNLGMSSILCGTSGATESKLVSPSDGTPCMPERFRRAGFHTAFYYSYKGAEFYSMKDHVGTLGFDQFTFGEQIMKPGDPFWQWGYEDCRFYDRAFEHMRSTGLAQKKKSFIYMSVHMHHVKFENHLKDVEHPFPKASGIEEEYLNSAFEQDHCMARFLNQVQGLKRKDLNVMIVGDHGYPVNSARGLKDHYMTSFYFVPSQNQASRFQKGALTAVGPAQDQILPTVLELFGTETSPASFLWALRGEPRPSNYRDCILVADAGAANAFVVEGAHIVQRLLRQEKYLAYDSTLQRVQELRKPSDWQTVQVSKSCLSRLGIPE